MSFLSLQEIRQECGVPVKPKERLFMEDKKKPIARIQIVNGVIENNNTDLSESDDEKEVKVEVKNKIKEKLKHEFFEKDNAVHFKLKGRALKDDLYTIVSKEHWPQISKYAWYLGKDGYAICYELNFIHLHTYIMKHLLKYRVPKSEGKTLLYIDHIDRDKLNNRDDNLRFATPQENAYNKSTKTNSKGVKKISEGNYTVSITKDGVIHQITDIPDRKQAAKIYNMMSEELFGNFAAKNVV
jgi:hypothetical protein